MSRPYSIVVLGLSITSSWGNGHATTYRALLRGLHELGRRVLFLERDVPWYAAHRDLPRPGYCNVALYEDIAELRSRWREALTGADAVILGSYVPQGVEVADILFQYARGTKAFYDIDTPVTLTKLSCGDEEYLSGAVIPAFDIYLSFTGGPVLKRLEQEFGARRAEALYCAVDEEHYRPLGLQPRWDLGYIGTYSDDRQPALERLLIEPARRLPGWRFVVAGPKYPASIDWPANIERIEHLSPESHPEFYGRQRFTLNVTRRDMVAAGWSPSVRLFEAAACGTPIISDVWPGLEELLPPGEALLLPRGSEEVVRILEDLPQADARRIGETARRIVLAAHTGRARAQHLLNVLFHDELSASPGTPVRAG